MACFRSSSVTGSLVNRAAAVLSAGRLARSVCVFFCSFRVLRPWLLPSGVECAVGFLGTVCLSFRSMLSCAFWVIASFARSSRRAASAAHSFERASGSLVSIFSVCALYTLLLPGLSVFPFDSLSLLLFVCIRFSRLFCRVLRMTTSCCTQYFCSCALQFMCHCRAAVHCLCLPPTLRTAVAAVHRVYCPCSSMPHFFNVPWYELP